MKKFNFKIARDTPKRSKDIFNLLPTIVNSAEYDEGFDSSNVLNNNMCSNGQTYKDLDSSDFYLSINHHLEEGKRIEDFLPDLKTNYSVQFDTKPFKRIVDASMKKKKVNYIGIYASCYSVLRHWNFWQQQEWVELCELIYANNQNVVFCVIGADFDIDLGTNIMLRLKEKKLPYLDCFGNHIGITIEIIKRLQYMVSFPSGIGIISTNYKIPTLFFYPPHLKKMQYAWASQEMIEDKSYMPVGFMQPNKAFEKIIHEYKLFKKLNY